MGRRSDILREQPIPQTTQASSNVIQVVLRAFEILRCFDGPNDRLSNRDLASRSGLPRSTVSRLACTLTQMGQLAYFSDDMKYGIGPGAIEMSLSIIGTPELPQWVAAQLQRVRDLDCADRQ